MSGMKEFIIFTLIKLSVRWLIAFFCGFISLAHAEVSRPIYGQLENGLRYTLVPLHAEKGHIEIRLKVDAGSVDENEDQAGVAHMLEHLVFRSTQNFPQSVMAYLHENQWVRGRNYNAVTTNDNTTYMLTPPKGEHVAQSLDVLSQMLFFAKLSQQDLDDERKIILEEWRAGQGVGSRMNRARTNVVRSNSRYTRHPVIGTEQSIKTMPASQLQQFYQQWYVPNNMQLLIVGDIDVAQVEQQITHYFGKIAFKTLPIRDYLEPNLTENLRTVQLQDEQSGASQIAYIVRFDEFDLRLQNEEGRYARLVDRLALATVTQRLRNQQDSLPHGIRSLVLRKSDIGKQTVALALFAGVEPDAHRLGLRQIFLEIARLQHFPITQIELDNQKEKIQEQIERAKQHNEDRDFSGWMQVMLNTVLSDKPYLTQREIALRTEPMLAKISVEDINHRIQYWFSQADQIVQYQAPRLTSIPTIEVEDVKQIQAKVKQSVIDAPQRAKIIEPMSLTVLTEQGSILSETAYDEENVHYFELSNGDKVVWLKSPLANQKSYFEARSSGGFNTPDWAAWKSQIATQLIAQNAPLDWEVEQLTHWKTLNKVNLSFNQSADALRYSAVVDNEKLAELLRLFYAYQRETWVKDGLDETKVRLLENVKQQHRYPDQQRTEALNQLLYGQTSLQPLPDEEALMALSETELNQIWARLRELPTTYYVMNNLELAQMRQLIRQYLAPLPRQQALESSPIFTKAGRETVRFPLNIEPKDQVQMWFFREQTWQGKEAVLVSLLKNIVTNKLKLSLRDQHLGIYSLHFESTLNPTTQRIESQLSFSANPEKTDELIALAEEALSHLEITQADVETAKAQFLQAEKARLAMPQTWLNRLILSDQQFQSPRYLTESRILAENITLEKMQLMADHLFDRNNVKVFITTQK